jgi:uncharacterized membrane protein YphA (DoxX/SURF4 family)
LTKELDIYLLRGGLAYSFLEWGLDAHRNPNHFYSYLSNNWVGQHLIDIMDPFLLIALLSLYELALAVWLLNGLLPRLFSSVALFTLIVFSATAGYPLALPQNIALAAAAWSLVNSKVNPSS